MVSRRHAIHHRKQKVPFFLYIATNAPHGPYRVDPKWAEPYKRNEVNNANFFGMIANIDHNLGLLRAHLKGLKLAENTILIFMTDNGTSAGCKFPGLDTEPTLGFNAGMRGGKASLNEGGSRVPLFFRLPGRTEPGRDLNQLARHIDMFPTFAEIAGADISDQNLEGRSLIPLLGKEEVAWPDRKLFFHGGRWAKTGAPRNFGKGDPNPDNYQYQRFAVRSTKWRLVGKDTLFDLENDPGEETNVIEANPEVAADLLQAYDGFWNRARPLLVNEDAPLDVEKPFMENYLKQKEAEGIPEWEKPSL